ncbi:unnamed protein product [Arctia plantaginis]|uniref:Dynein axonemal light chain 1 n=1 Tax=Arctia plantaginis TaxID=874455 RepID=A0A8S1B9F5_ARCPL|nr:unnamed protein product [Arctia plantaginis]CAB3255497.1 unnamed protein product [Arctia plantaginis]
MALRPTTCKEAISLFERENHIKATEATVVELRFQWPPIEKMDRALSTLVACEKLTLSSNMIDKIAGLAGMRNLRILMVDRNYIKSLIGLEAVAGTLEQLWISYNCLKNLEGVGCLKKLKVLYMPYNHVEEWTELNRLQECSALRDFFFTGNPLVETQPDIKSWRTYAIKHIQQITMLDGEPINKV